MDCSAPAIAANSKPVPKAGTVFRKRFWHRRAKKYLYAKDYGDKAWLIGECVDRKSYP